MLDAEFAMILYDKQADSYIAARDPIGIRPLYYGVQENGTYVFASEPKNLVGLVGTILPFPPGHYFKDGVFTCYRDMSEVKKRFFELGFNIEATAGTGQFLKQHGIRTRIRGKISEGSEEILQVIRAGYVSYIINTRAILSGVHYEDGAAIRRCAIMNGEQGCQAPKRERSRYERSQ